MTLYGICRELNKCVCGLCAQIQYGSNKGMAERGRPLPHKPGCDQCGALRRRKNHACPTNKRNKEKALPKPKAMPKKALSHIGAIKKPTLLHGDPTEPLPCGCIMWRGRRTKWCYNAHTPQTHPNSCQHSVTITQNFGTPDQKKVCVGCSNDISK